MKNRTTVTLGGLAVGILSALPAIAGNDNINANTSKVEHVLLISAAGFGERAIATWWGETPERCRNVTGGRKRFDAG
jgi:hypothetical protein